MDPSAFTWRRWRTRFRTDEAVAEEQGADGHAPDATSAEVGVPSDNVGFEGRPLRSRVESGYGSGVVGGSGWSGWSGMGS